ncbi:MAG: MBL fold metallo-hydrolase [Chloroflexota bacterium]|nr:MAG: MBL fold metallo-hydrolase [Chloroflexota bacterium]
MLITFHGAAQTVTGSQHLLEVNGYHLLLECGLYQGRRKEAFKRNRNFPFDPGKIDAVLLSHAHIDHSGNLPSLVKKGFRGPIYTTDATAHLANVMLIDSGHIHESDAEFLNKRFRNRGEQWIEPLYTIEDASQVAQYFECQAYDHPFQVVPGVRAQLVDAGHILGSAAIVLDIEEGGKHFRLWFSGDVGRRDLPLLRDPVLPSGADYLIMECTYGDKTHQTPQASYDELKEVINNSISQGGKVIIPAFAVGRTQELVYCLHRMIDAGEIPRIPVFVDSPLAVNISEIFRAHPECFDAETREFLHDDVHRSALGEGLVTYIRSVERSKALNEDHRTMVIISASGMAETGRILHHLRNNIEDPRNTILIVSWQAPHTLGRRLADRVTKVKIFGEEFRRRAQVVTIGGFSAHGGQPFLLEYGLASRHTLKRIFLVHGEQRGAEPIQQKLKSAGIKRILFPAMHQTVEVGKGSGL